MNSKFHFPTDCVDVTIGFYKTWKQKKLKKFYRNDPILSTITTKDVKGMNGWFAAVQWNRTNIITLGSGLVEEETIPVLCHEILHFILWKVEDSKTSQMLDNLGNFIEFLDSSGLRVND